MSLARPAQDAPLAVVGVMLRSGGSCELALDGEVRDSDVEAWNDCIDNLGCDEGVDVTVEGGSDDAALVARCAAQLIG